MVAYHAIGGDRLNPTSQEEIHAGDTLLVLGQEYQLISFAGLQVKPALQKTRLERLVFYFTHRITIGM